MTSTLEPAYYAYEIMQVAKARGWTIRQLSPCASGPRPWLYRAGSNPSAPHVYFSSGIHGDEVSGPLALLEAVRHPHFFGEFETTIFPILNPDGIAKGTRENAAGIDLNRDYRNTQSDEILSHKDALETLPALAGAMYLHEDFEGTGAYIYELNEAMSEPSLGAQIIQAMSAHVPIDLRPEIEEVAAKGGVLSRRDLLQKYGSIEERPDWPEAIYLSVHHTKLSYTTETPKLQPLPHRVHAQLAAMTCFLAALRLPQQEASHV